MTRTRVPHTRLPRAPVSRPNTSATGRPERPDPCADPPTVRIDPTRVMPRLPFADALAGHDTEAATVPRLRPVTPAGGEALGVGRVLAAGSAVGALVGVTCWVVCWLLAARLAPVLLWAVPGAAAVDVLARRYGRRPATVAPSPVLGSVAAARFAATLLHHVAPLTVVLVAGPGPGMPFFVAWQVVTAVDLAAVGMLGRPGGAGRARLPAMLGPAMLGPALLVTALLVTALLVTALLVTGLLARPLLAVIGPDHTPGADVLRVLLVGAAFRLVVVHELAEREAAGQAWSAARLQLVTTLSTLLAVGGTIAVVAAVRLVPTAADAAPPGAVRAVLLPVAAASVLVQVACAAAALVPRPGGHRARPEG